MRVFRSLTVLLVALPLLGAAPNDAPAPPAGPVEAYVRAVALMRALPEPAYVEYTTSYQSDGNMHFGVSRVRERYAFFYVQIGGKDDAPRAFPTRVRTSDDRRAISLNGKPAIVRTPLFDATWNGVYDWLRYGIEGAPLADPASSPVPSAAPAAQPAPSASLPPVIGGVQAFSSRYYTIADAGTRACRDGAPGRRLSLAAKADPDAHPLTEVVLDPASRICLVHFRLGRKGAASFTGDFELAFGTVGEYWLVRDGTADFAARMLGIRGGHAHVAFRYGEVTFPAAIPPAEFDP